MKSYTDIEQSKKLAEILPIESADAHYVREITDFMGNSVDGKWSYPKYGNPKSNYASYIVQNFSSNEVIPCWSLAALLDVLPKYELNNFGDTIQLDVNLEALATEGDETLLDLVVNMIIHLYQLKIL